MTDEELIKRLLLLNEVDAEVAAKRIAALLKQRDAIAALPAVTVGVKSLVFEGRNGFWRADDGIGGFYEVTEVYSALHMCRIVVGVANKLIPYNSKDAAFGAANVEHQRRIRAALEHAAPDPAAIRGAALLSDAANIIRDLLAAYSKPDERLCCNGRGCGCQGATVQMQAEYYANEFLALIAKGAADDR